MIINLLSSSCQDSRHILDDTLLSQLSCLLSVVEEGFKKDLDCLSDVLITNGILGYDDDTVS